MFGGTKTIIGLDVGSYGVKAVALQPSKGGRLTLQGYAQLPVSEQDHSLVVRKVIDMLGVKPRHVVTAVSGRSVIVRQVETPRLGDSELRNHIAVDVDKYIPFSTDEVVIDCQPLPDVQESDGPTQSMDVLLVAVRRGFIEDHVSMLQAAGVHPSVVDVDVFALVNAFLTFGPGAAENHDGATALVDVGSTKSWVAIIKGERLLFSREIYMAGNEITDAIVRTFNEAPEDIERIKLNPGDTLDALLDAATPALEDLANEIRLSFDYVEGQFEQEVSRVVLTGGSALLPGLPETLGNILGRAVGVFDPLSAIDLIPSRYDLHGLEANAPALTIALGLACHELGDDIRGLGSGHLVTWQSVRGRASAIGMAAVDHSDDDDMSAEMAPQDDPDSLAPPPPQAFDEPLPLPGFDAPPPAENDNAFFPDLGGAPPAADGFELPAEDANYEPPEAQLSPLAGIMPDDEDEDDYDNNRSSLLVVLEDEEEGAASEDDDDQLPPLPG